MNIIAVLPARYAATRFPGKLMEMLGDKTVIARTYLATKATSLFDEVIVATDSEIIRQEILNYGGKVVMTSSNHEVPKGTNAAKPPVANFKNDHFKICCTNNK